MVFSRTPADSGTMGTGQELHDREAGVGKGNLDTGDDSPAPRLC